jgi:YegS/Rv2252/BmrU family lipid kinase
VRAATVDAVRSALVIANADAGTSDPAAIRAAVDQLARGGIDVDVRTTQGSDDLDDILAARADRDVVVAGGDGSLHTVVSALRRRGELDGPTIGLIPLGTGNDFARSVGIPLDPAEAAAVCARGVPHPIDLVVDNDDGVVVNAVNIGIGAEASRRAAGLKPRLGRFGYAVGALAAGLTTRGLRLRVEADSTPLADGSQPVLQVGIGNGGFVGGGTPLTPDAHPSDAHADVVVSFAVGPVRRFLYAVQLRQRTHIRRRDVASAQAAVVRVSGDEFWCSADGELSGPHTDRTWSVLPRAFRVALPDRALRRCG